MVLIQVDRLTQSIILVRVTKYTHVFPFIDCENFTFFKSSVQMYKVYYLENFYTFMTQRFPLAHVNEASLPLHLDYDSLGGSKIRKAQI